ncbi:hypothetical protein C8N36_12612 [Pelagimonas varians]|uniref:Uncharacterized protein n=1 Tax=Pelagimonas varians TaxID=696760 RepID=A0A238L5D4_9RHOB|nr:hypothetical protein C8N36_12612 [Pelagimonas varians]SMX50060.1 hypothetical protein PEV8663_04465 [Pelagimonas varians]
MMQRTFKIIFWVFIGLYIVALALFLVGTFGLFGAARDPLSGIFLIPLGWPWNFLTDVFPEVLWPWVAAAMPTANAGILGWLSYRISST